MLTSIVTSILSSTVGLLWNKAQDATAEKLKDGDITDAQIRKLVVRELDDIKTKINGLSRKDLLSSYSFLQEGVQLLNVSLDKSKDEEKAGQRETQLDDCGETSSMPSGDESANILNKALELSNAMGKLKIVSNESESAKKRFEDARKEATHAFCNEAFDIQDRIFAAKLRVVSEILECLDNPDTAVTSCLLFLEKLHDLPAVREIFSVYLGGGVKSIFGKTERVDNVKSVMMINYVLYQFVSKFSSKYCSVLAWPTIRISDRSFNPILNLQELSGRKSWGKELMQPPNEMKLDRYIIPCNTTVNSRGDIFEWYGNDIVVIYRTGESKVVKPFSVPSKEGKEGEVINQEIRGLAVDHENNVYVVLYCETTSQNYSVLYILDEYCNRIKQKSKLNFLLDLKPPLKLAINNNNNILMIPTESEDHHVYVCDHIGQLKYKFKHETSSLSYASISDNNETILASHGGKAVEMCTEEENLTLKIELPADHVVCGIAYHSVIRKIIVLTEVRESDPHFLHCYSEKGDLETSMRCFDSSEVRTPAIMSHPSGPVAVVRGSGNITYL